MHHDIGIGQNFAYSRGHRGRNLLGTLEGEIAFQPDGNIAKNRFPALRKRTRSTSSTPSTVLIRSKI